MQIASANPVLQSLSGAQETGTVRHHATSGKTETARAVSAAEKPEGSRPTQVRLRREAEDDDNTAPKPRGSLVDIVA